ncbi:hypothetical protein NT2_01_03470 [Caenibius tardaugens NBRC 16725]|uniref:Uncharacterized protein n=1 Tax=Caenibius tardaugens NBRC 16725 TaxID=1219035 RepID=U2ZYH5_9SPHN|nr:hypothetical protein NT2_01_03470 [Caenibius tardaugens NBRC 16725]
MPSFVGTFVPFLFLHVKRKNDYAGIACALGGWILRGNGAKARPHSSESGLIFRLFTRAQIHMGSAHTGAAADAFRTVPASQRYNRKGNDYGGSYRHDAAID